MDAPMSKWGCMNRGLSMIVIMLAALGLSTKVGAQETIEYYGLDAVGSVRVVFDASGNVLGRMDYGPFGQELSNGTGLPSRAYAGLFRDGEAGLDHAEARSFQSRTGRFTSVDPMYSGLFNPQGWNRYAYALNNPTEFVDPSGLGPCTLSTGQPGFCSGTVGVDPYSASTASQLARWWDMMFGPGGYVDRMHAKGSTATTSGPGPTGPTAEPPPGPPPPPPPSPPPGPGACSLLPEGRTVGANVAVGGLGATVVGAELVYNYNTGEVSAFSYAGAQGGWNGVASVSVTSGLIRGLGNTNWNYKGPFVGSAAGLGPIGVFGSGSPDGKVAVGGFSIGQSLVGRVQLSVSATIYSKPYSLGNFAKLGGPEAEWTDYAFLAARAVLCNK